LRTIFRSAAASHARITDRFMRPYADGQAVFTHDGAVRLNELRENERQAFRNGDNLRLFEQKPSQRIKAKITEAIDVRHGRRD
jgi:hypothetical protein